MLRSVYRWLRLTSLALPLVAASAAAQPCGGDCDGDREVTVDEIVRGVAIALGNVELSACPVFDANVDEQVTVDELVRAIQSALNGCPPEPTATPTPTLTATVAATSTPTGTATPTFIVDTPTATVAPPTATATATATPKVAVCGNGLLEVGEKCDTCAADCQITACTPSGRHLFEVRYAGSRSATSLAVLLTYRSSLASLPGSANQATVGQRVTERPSGTFVVNDLNYALRSVIGGSTPKPAGKLYVVDFDGCQGAGAPTSDDLVCMIEGCSDAFGPIPDCTCEVVPR